MEATPPSSDQTRNQAAPAGAGPPQTQSSVNLGLRLQDLQNNTPQLVNEPPNTVAAGHHNLQQWLQDMSPYNHQRYINNNNNSI